MRGLFWALTAVAACGLLLVACGPPAQPAYVYKEGGGTGGPVGPGGKPRWVDKAVDDIHNLNGVGQGSERGPCENSARAELAKRFVAHIQQVSTDWQSHFSKANSAGRSVRVEAMSITQLTRVTTDKVLRGVKIGGYWQGDGEHHCLAQLDRMSTARSLRAEIAKLDATIKAKVVEGDGAPNPTAKFMAYSRAMSVMQEREALNVDLRIVDPRGVGVPPPISWNDLVARFTGAKSKSKVGLKLLGTKAATIQTCLAEELGKAGIQVVEGSSDVDVMVHGNLKYEKAGVIGGSVMVRANVNLRLTDIEGGRTLGAFHENIKVGRPTLPQSVQLAVYKLCQKVVPTLVTKLKAAFGR
jgi:LPP20 lipoprotein